MEAGLAKVKMYVQGGVGGGEAKGWVGPGSRVSTEARLKISGGQRPKVPKGGARWLLNHQSKDRTQQRIEDQTWLRHIYTMLEGGAVRESLSASFEPCPLLIDVLREMGSFVE